jgi:uncharacterized protein (DUF362 family)
MDNLVSLVESQNHQQGVKNSLEKIKEDLESKLSSVDRVVIKINFVNTTPELATTPFDAVKAFVEFVKPFYSGEIVIAEQASGGNTKKGFERYGFTDFADKNDNVRLLSLADDEAVNITLEYPEGEIDFPLSQTIVEAPFLVSITRPKTHNNVVVTLGIKNVLVGVIKGDLGVRRHIHQGMHIHQMMVDIAKRAYPDLVVLDGNVGMEGNGPTGGTPIEAGWALSSLDALAADSLATYLMGFDIDDVGYLNMLWENGYGMLYPKEDIEIVGADPDELQKEFKPHRTFESQRQWRV